MPSLGLTTSQGLLVWTFFFNSTLQNKCCLNQPIEVFSHRLGLVYYVDNRNERFKFILDTATTC